MHVHTLQAHSIFCIIYFARDVCFNATEIYRLMLMKFVICNMLEELYDYTSEIRTC